MCKNSLEEAIKKVGKAMGEAKYDDAMGGAMLPKGDINAIGAICVLFNVKYDEVKGWLYGVQDREYKRLLEKTQKEYKRFSKRG
jgi:hypothetical protein